MRLRLAQSISLVLVVAAVSNALARQDPAARGSVPVYATITDRAGLEVVDLRPEEITLRANGKPVSVVSLSRDTRPLSMMIILDSSASLASKSEAMRLVAGGFLSQLRPHDRARVGAFSDTIQFSNAFIANPDELMSALRTIKGGNPTRLHDALVASAELLKGESGRRIVVVLSDGEDTSSRSSISEALEALHAHHVTVYSVGVEAVFNNGARIVRARPHRDLKRFAEDTGGGYFELRPDIDLTAQILRTLHEMRSGYLLTFTPPLLDGKKQNLRLETGRAGVLIRARKSYIARVDP